MSQLLIGLTGPARTGKSTTAHHLALEHGFECYAFADPLRDALMAIFQLSPEDFEGAAKEEPIAWLGRSPRQLMQLLGTEWGRHMISANLWVDLAEQHLDALANASWPSPSFVISDLRFENEADFVRKRGGVVVHLQRFDAPKVNPHLSEAGVSLHKDDLVLVNDGDLASLHHQVESMLHALHARRTRSAA
ncbi:deoxynucleotide monophosphate kinase [Pseudomonas abietaniphila]|uniref:deoxynucleotide monophosphate kinase family protein n=1 Tax=Pseudomonas abietaniphila TaxID=89065 RepID=UPI003216DE64